MKVSVCVCVCLGIAQMSHLSPPPLCHNCLVLLALMLWRTQCLLRLRVSAAIMRLGCINSAARNMTSLDILISGDAGSHPDATTCWQTQELRAMHNLFHQKLGFKSHAVKTLSTFVPHRDQTFSPMLCSLCPAAQLLWKPCVSDCVYCFSLIIHNLNGVLLVWGESFFPFVTVQFKAPMVYQSS